MTRFSANLGFLWNDLPLTEAVHAAKAAGFDAVECHWPYDVPVAEINRALRETGLEMLSLNTRRGDIAAGEIGLSALPGREGEARAAIDEAITYAAASGTANVHVMAGTVFGKSAHETFTANLAYACNEAQSHGITILIEPLNHHDAPGYFLQTTGQAKAILEEINAPNLKIMFDCYHVQIMEGDLTRRLENLLGDIGHIQFASVPDRGPPDHGEINYSHIFSLIEKLGYQKPLGAEYKSGGDTNAALGWMRVHA